MLLANLSVRSRHEVEIAKALGAENLCYKARGPNLNKSLVLVAFTNRSGSNLLTDYLRQTGKIGGLTEGLNFDSALRHFKAHNLTSMPQYIAHLVKQQCKHHAVFGLKASSELLATVLRWNLLSMFPSVKVVHIIRNDAVSQAVSLSIADQTKKWTSRQVANGVEPVLNVPQIEKIISNQREANLRIELICRAHRLDRFPLSYERVCASPDQTVRDVMSFLGFDQNWKLNPPAIEKQADDVNAAFVSAFDDAARDAIGAQPKKKQFSGLFKWLR